MILILTLVLLAAAFVGVAAAISAKAERYMDDIVKKTIKRQRKLFFNHEISASNNRQ